MALKTLSLHLSDSLTRAKKLTSDGARKRLEFLYKQKSAWWQRQREKKMLALFHTAAKDIPAYKNFLKKNHIDPTKIRTFTDWKTVPPMTKDSYLRKYSWRDLCPTGALTMQSLVLTSTSGSTGTPFYFPRNGLLDEQATLYHELFVCSSGLDPKKPTLVLICFGMGVWIGGVITYQAFKHLSERGYAFTILTPGVNKKEIFEALRNVAPHYEQLILCGYPPFVKDIIDEGKAEGIRWQRWEMRLICAAEGFSEKYRDYLMRKTGMQNPYRDTMNIYGSADLGTMAEETPIAILIRRLALKHKNLYQKLFGQATRLPTLAQFLPQFASFEAQDNNIYLTGDNVLPLIRYEIGDQGGVLSFIEVEELCKSEGIDLLKHAKRAGIEDTIAELPFVYIYERTDLSTKLYGAIIFPEHVKAGLQTETLEKYVTGKFTMFTRHDKNQDEYLEINVELKPGITESDWLAREVAQSIGESLRTLSAEHANNANMMGSRVDPRIIFWPHEHPLHFQPGIKQKWVKKEAN